MFLKSNKVMKTDDRIIAILVHLKRDIVGIYIQKKLNELDKKLETQNWEEFVKELKIKTVDVEWRIESFK